MDESLLGLLVGRGRHSADARDGSRNPRDHQRARLRAGEEAGFFDRIGKMEKDLAAFRDEAEALANELRIAAPSGDILDLAQVASAQTQEDVWAIFRTRADRIQAAC
jgi:hypothetical protein